MTHLGTIMKTPKMVSVGLKLNTEIVQPERDWRHFQEAPVPSMPGGQNSYSGLPCTFIFY